MQSLVLDPPSVFALVDKASVQKINQHKLRCFLMGVVAGLYVAMSGQAFIAVTATDRSMPNVALGGVLFATGLHAIIHLGGELFTGNCMMIMALLNRHANLLEILLEWGIVYVGNFVGTIAFAAVFTGGGLLEQGTPNGDRLCQMAILKANLPQHNIFFRGIMANFCVCISILLAMASTSSIGKYFAAIMPITVFVVSGYEHCVANMFTFSAATMSRCNVSNHGWYWANLVLASLGNVVGASILACLYWATYSSPLAKPTAESTSLAQGSFGAAPVVDADETKKASEKSADADVVKQPLVAAREPASDAESSPSSAFATEAKSA